MFKQNLADYTRRQQSEGISVMRKHQFQQKNETNVFRKVYQKYRIMMIRNKISYMAFEKGQTLLEFLIIKIYETYNKLKEDKLIFEDPEKIRLRKLVLDNISNN